MNKYIIARKKFNNSNDYNTIIDWENYKTNDLILSDTNISINGNNKDKTIPVFQKIVENNINKEQIIYEDDKIIALIPMKNDKPDSELNLMSYCHFLLIPKRRIYNAVSLKITDLPLLLYMKYVGNKIMKTLLTSNYDSNKKLNNMSYKDLKYMGFNYNKNLRTGLGLSIKSAKQQYKSLQFSVHLSPKHSVSYLHIHCYIENLMLDTVDKNYYLSHVINYFYNLKNKIIIK